MNQRLMRGAAMATALIANLAAAPVTTAADNVLPVGTHDGYPAAIAAHGNCYANGWAVDPDDPGAPVTVQILADGSVVGEVEAIEYRQDIVDAGIDPDGTAGFWIDLGPLVSSDERHTIVARARDAQTAEWVQLDETSRTITCTNLFGYHDSPAGTFGRSECVVGGWAFDADTPTDRVRVRIKVDGRIVATSTANGLREDVRDAGYGDGYSGWSVNLFGRITPLAWHVVTAEARDTTANQIWTELADTNRLMRCLPLG